MLIARKLKQENIAEYLLYMWQIEDLIRAFDFDMDAINEKIIIPYQLPEKDQKELYDWYESLIDMMKRENIQKSGHLQLNKNVLIELNEFHQKLLRSNKDAAYSAKFYHILPFIMQLRRKENAPTTTTDIEVCFNFLYGIMLLKMMKQAISKETEDAQTEISRFIVLLVKDYNKYKSEELTFGDE